jgi:hypothetical protein
MRKTRGLSVVLLGVVAIANASCTPFSSTEADAGPADAATPDTGAAVDGGTPSPGSFCAKESNHTLCVDFDAPQLSPTFDARSSNNGDGSIEVVAEAANLGPFGLRASLLSGELPAGSTKASALNEIRHVFAPSAPSKPYRRLTVAFDLRLMKLSSAGAAESRVIHVGSDAYYIELSLYKAATDDEDVRVQLFEGGRSIDFSTHGQATSAGRVITAGTWHRYALTIEYGSTDPVTSVSLAIDGYPTRQNSGPVYNTPANTPTAYFDLGQFTDVPAESIVFDYDNLTADLGF